MSFTTESDWHREIIRRLDDVAARSEHDCVAEYASTLFSFGEAFGSGALTQDEALLSSAVALDMCIQSGGLESCFQYAARDLLRGEAAMKLLGLTVHADLMRLTLETAALDDRATAEALQTFFFSLLGKDEFEQWARRLDPIDGAYHALGLSAVSEAALAYIMKHHRLLRRSLLQEMKK